MENNKSIRLITLVILLSLLLVGLGSYIVYDKLLSNNNIIENNDNKNINNDENNQTSYKILLSDICPETGDCTKNLDDIMLSDQTYKVSIQKYDEVNEPWSNGIYDSIRLNDKILDTDEGFIRFIAVMNNEYLVIGINGLSPEDVYNLIIFDNNLNKVETFISYNHEQGIYDLNKNIIDNNTTLLYYDCSVPENDDENNPNNQTLTTYSVKFNNSNFSATKTSVVENTFCTSQMP